LSGLDNEKGIDKTPSKSENETDLMLGNQKTSKIDEV
jgi:hypothetical protein